MFSMLRNGLVKPYAATLIGVLVGPGMLCGAALIPRLRGCGTAAEDSPSWRAGGRSALAASSSAWLERAARRRARRRKRRVRDALHSYGVLAWLPDLPR